MDKIISALAGLAGAGVAISGAWATIKLIMMGFAHMNKNPQKVEAARDGITNIVIGFFICLSATVIISWLKTVLG